MEDIVENFLRSSIEGRMEEFDFDEAFGFVESALHYKLAEHGLLSLEEFIDAEENYLCVNPGILEPYTTKSDYIYISEDELHDALIKYRYEKFRETFVDYGSFQELMRLYNEVKVYTELPLTEKVILFDACIHAEHETGMIFDIDIDMIKAKLDKEYQ